MLAQNAIRVGIIAVVVLLLAVVVTGAVYDPTPGPLRLARSVVSVDGSELSFHQVGRGHDVVLLHGLMGSAEDFEPVLSPLAADHRVTAVDRPGFGRSRARAGDANYPGNARRVAQLIRSLALVRPVVVGHSYGGAVALQLAADEPSLVSGLVLLAPAGYPSAGRASALDHVVKLPVLGEGLAAWLGPVLAPGMIAEILKSDLGPDAPKVPADFVSWRTRLWTKPRSITTLARQDVSAEGDLRALAPGYPRLHVPTIVLWCDGDPLEGHELDSPRLAREIPGAREVRLTGCGHYVQFGHPDAVVAAIAGLTAAGAAEGAQRVAR